jgi:hypothetical protein
VPVFAGDLGLEVETGDEVGPGTPVGGGDEGEGGVTVTLERGIDDKTGFRDGGGVEEVVKVVVPEGGNVEDGGVADPVSLELEGGGRPAETVHNLTTWMRDSPCGPITGVNVRVHVSVTGPASV